MKTAYPIIFFMLLFTGILFPACKGPQKLAKDTRQAEQMVEVSPIRQLESTALLIDATRQKILGNWSNAIVLYAESLKADPNNTAALYELAKIHARQGHLTDAEIFAKKATTLDPENVYYQLVLADIYFLQTKNQEGLDVQRALANKNPNNLNLQASLLSSLIYMEKFHDAITLLAHIESITGFNDEMSLQKQKLYLETGQQEKAIKEAQRLVAFFPQEAVYLELLAELYQETGQEENAFTIYHQMLEIQPDNAMARLLLADYYRKSGQEEESFRQLKLAFQSPQFTVEGKSRIMFSFYHLSEQDEKYLAQSYELLHLLIEAHSDDAEANALFGDFLYRDKKQQEARQYFYRAAKLKPSEVRFWQQVLVIDSTLGDYDNMLEASEEALEYFFEHPVLYLFNGMAHMQKKNYEQAISAFNSGRDLTVADPEFQAQFLTLLGDTHYKAGNHNDSDRAYEEALALDPDNLFALNNYSYHLSERGIKLEKALEYSTRALAAEPENEAFLDTYGWIQYKLGDYTQAEKFIRKAIDASEAPSAAILEHYGDVLFKLGKEEQALEYWQKALNAKEEENDDDVSEFLRKKVRDKTLYE